MALIEGWFDGCCEPRNPGGHAAWGAMLRLDGTTVFADGGYCGYGPKMSNNVAEYSAAATVMAEAEKYEGVIILRGDSKLVVMQLQRKWKINGGLYYPFYLQAKEVYARIKDRTKLEWIPREKNDECDYLSKQVLKDRNVVFRIQPELQTLETQ
jgi:ribonuclease HI